MSILCVLCAGCGGEASKPDATRKSSPVNGITNARSEVPTTAAKFVERPAIPFVYRNGEEAGNFAILESLGGGLALFDYDRDGDLDVCVAGGGEFPAEREIRGLPLGLYRNDGEWKFTRATEEAGLAESRFYSHGVNVGDYDDDGFPDILVTGYGGLVLYRNNGDGTFDEVTMPAGLIDEAWSASSAWGDLNGDGFLDLYVAHYVNWSWDNHPFCPGPLPGQREVCPPKMYDPLPDTLYFSNGDGTFRDGTKEAGLKDEGKGLGVVIADMDGDGRCDVYVGNDTVPNYLYHNVGNGALKDVSMMSGTSLDERGVPNGSMGVDVGDFNLDGLPDLWVANYENESFALYRNEGGMFFQPVSQSTGITATGQLYVGWGTVLFDFDRDRDEDAFVSTGHVIRYPKAAPLRQQPLLFENQSGKWFVNVAQAAGGYLAESHQGRGVAVGDLDGNHLLDLAVSHVNEPVSLLANETPSEHGWLELSLVGTRSNRDAIGARVKVELVDLTVWRQVKGGGSYASTSTPTLHFGIPKGAVIKSVTAYWPDGKEQALAGVAAGRRWLAIEGRSPLACIGE